MHREQLDQEEQPRDQRKVLVGVVGQVGELHRVERKLIVKHDAQRVAVVAPLRAGLRARNAGSAAAVVDHDRLSEPRASSFAAARMMTSVRLPAAIETIMRIGLWTGRSARATGDRECHSSPWPREQRMAFAVVPENPQVLIAMSLRSVAAGGRPVSRETR